METDDFKLVLIKQDMNVCVKLCSYIFYNWLEYIAVICSNHDMNKCIHPPIACKCLDNKDIACRCFNSEHV